MAAQGAAAQGVPLTAQATTHSHALLERGAGAWGRPSAGGTEHPFSRARPQPSQTPVTATSTNPVPAHPRRRA